MNPIISQLEALKGSHRDEFFNMGVDEAIEVVLANEKILIECPECGLKAPLSEWDEFTPSGDNSLGEATETSIGNHAGGAQPQDHALTSSDVLLLFRICDLAKPYVQNNEFNYGYLRAINDCRLLILDNKATAIAKAIEVVRNDKTSHAAIQFVHDYADDVSDDILKGVAEDIINGRFTTSGDNKTICPVCKCPCVQGNMDCACFGNKPSGDNSLGVNGVQSAESPAGQVENAALGQFDSDTPSILMREAIANTLPGQLSDSAIDMLVHNAMRVMENNSLGDTTSASTSHEQKP